MSNYLLVTLALARLMGYLVAEPSDFVFSIEDLQELTPDQYRELFDHLAQWGDYPFGLVSGPLQEDIDDSDIIDRTYEWLIAKGLRKDRW